jgi:hypothetical protein
MIVSVVKIAMQNFTLYTRLKLLEFKLDRLEAENTHLKAKLDELETRNAAQYDTILRLQEEKYNAQISS